MGIKEAKQTVNQFTVAACATGAIPVPAASVAIVAENAAMIGKVASDLGVDVSLADVVASMGTVAAVNAMGRAVFVEAARAIGWFAGPAGVAGVCALGATTAGLQTYVLGNLAIAIAQNDGRALSPEKAKRIQAQATRGFKTGKHKEKGEIHAR